jgi:hypothetical protein
MNRIENPFYLWFDNHCVNLSNSQIRHKCCTSLIENLCEDYRGIFFDEKNSGFQKAIDKPALRRKPDQSRLTLFPELS